MQAYNWDGALTPGRPYVLLYKQRSCLVGLKLVVLFFSRIRIRHPGVVGDGAALGC